LDSDNQKQNELFSPIALDLILAFLIGIGFLGGISWKGHLYLRHSIDCWRIAVAVGIVTLLLCPKKMNKSLFIRTAFFLKQKLNQSRFRIFFLTGMLGFAIILAITQTLALRVPLFDVGIFHQILWSLSHGLKFHSTISGAGNFLLDHASPSLMLLVPFFKIFKESVFFLPVTQAILLFGGGAAWVYYAATIHGIRQESRNELAAATILFLASFNSLWKNLKWGFHENALAFFMLSWGLALLFTYPIHLPNRIGFRRVLIFIILLIAAGSKEILLLEVSLVFFIWGLLEFKILSKHHRVQKWIYLIALWFTGIFLVFGFFWFEAIPHPADKNYFIRYYSYLGKDLKSFIYSLTHSPGEIFHAIGFKEILKYLISVFSPWLFLPLLPIIYKEKTPFYRISLIIIVPSFASAALATYPPLKSPDVHYILELWPPLAFLTLTVLAKINSSALVWTWVLFSFIRFDFDALGYLREYTMQLRNNQRLRSELAQIPPHASVIADELAGPWVSGRKWVTRWPDTFFLHNPCPDFIVIRMPTPPAKEKLEQFLHKCPELKSFSSFPDGWSVYSALQIK
jgi:uncharacterized membrane protein